MSWLFGTPLSRARRWVAQLSEDRHSKQAEEELLRLGKEAVPALLEALAAPDQTLRSRAAQVLIRFGPLATPLLVAQLNTSPPLVQLQICEIFARTRPREALSALLAALRSPIAEVRLRASEVIGLIGDPSILPLLKQLAQDHAADVRIAGVMALAHFPQAVPFLSDLLLDDAALEVRQAAARALARLRDPSSLPTLIEALQDNRWWYEREKEIEDLLNAILAFGAQAVPFLLQIVEHPERAVRRFAVILLGKLKDPRALPALEIALYDLHFEVGEAAAQALLGMDGEAANILHQALRHPEATIRERVVRALQQMPNLAFTPALIECLQDASETVRLEAVQALARSKDRRALPALQALAADRSNRTLSNAARSAIQAITGNM